MADKENLHRYLVQAREDLVGKLDGLSEYDARRPLTPTGTNLLGLVKHLADGERWWFAHHVGGDPAYADTDFSMLVPEDVSAAQVVADYRAAIEEADRHIAAARGIETLTALPVGETPRTLRWVLAHMTSEVARHVGHMDILREQIDEVTGR